jgi:GT2 family glycosyltransferase
MKDAFVLVGCPLPHSFRADARVVGVLEAWRSSGVITYYPVSSSAEQGQDMIIKFARHMQPRPTHVLFVDYDVLPRPSTLLKLLQHNKDIISGVYPTTQKCRISWCLSRGEPFETMPINELPDNPFKASVICNGMMLVKMDVFDNLEWPYWRSEYVKGGILTGADLYFCRKARAAGYDLWVDPKIKCNHFKMVDLLGIAKLYIERKTK